MSDAIKALREATACDGCRYDSTSEEVWGRNAHHAVETAATCDDCAAICAEAVAAVEREACAAICDTAAQTCRDRFPDATAHRLTLLQNEEAVAEELADAIRTRATK